jgi:hypothetical protein
MKKGTSLLAFTVLVVLRLNASADTHYVDLNGPNPTPPYTNWPTAATNIQDALNAAVAGDQILVTNGIYEIGATAYLGSNRVSVTKALTVKSVNGPAETIIKGFQVPGMTNGASAIRCVYLTNGATLSGFTLTNGATQTSVGNTGGGGAYCQSTSAVLTNCVISGNQAHQNGGGAYSGTLIGCSLVGNGARLDATGLGGGAHGSVLINCFLMGNKAGYQGGGANACILTNCLVYGNTVPTSYYGGGTALSTLVNCTVVSNSAYTGGGSYGDTLKNCIVYYNQSFGGSSSNYFGGFYTNCCTLPNPSSSANNITNQPVFLGLTGGVFQLQSNSPCINAGNSSYVVGSTDLDGNPRISGGTVDIGAYELQSPASVLSYAWAQQYGLPTDGTADFADVDGEGASNWHEWRADTVPTNASSALLMGSATNGVSGLVVSWASVATRSYWLERASDLGATPSFQSMATNIPGVAGTKTFNDTSATNGGPYFYRVGVQ